MSELHYHSDGDQLWALTQGEPGRPVLVLLHPTPLNHGFWLPVLERLSGRLSRNDLFCVLPDLRGHGRSPLGDRDVLTIEQLGRDLVALLGHIGAQQAICVGCSIGGYTLYELWRQAPERVRAAGFCSSKPHPDLPEDTARRAGWIAKMLTRAAAGESTPGEEFTEAMIATLTSAETQARRGGELDQLQRMIEQVRPQAVAAIQRGLGARPDSRPAAATFTRPALVIAGEHDGSSTPGEMAELATLLGSKGAAVQFEVLGGAGHYAPWEEPDHAAELLGRFLDAVLGTPLAG